ncbi:MAG TPA: hypothetical protein VHC43_08720 [Mycobacteriales bacterium]|nr:hypothetical protein [Mycobacteriales bacterium]
MNQPTSRWRRSTMSFGPVGRMLWTVVCLVIAVYPIWKAVTAGWIYVSLYLGGIPLLFVLFPLVMRDVWKKVPNPDYEPPIALPPDVEPPKPGESINDRKLPQRW